MTILYKYIMCLVHHPLYHFCLPSLWSDVLSYTTDRFCVSEWKYKRSDHRDFYHARWWPDKKASHVYFDLMARSQPTHWIGVGFSQERMPVVCLLPIM